MFISHDIEEAIELGSRVLVLGKPAPLLTDIAMSQDAKQDAVRRGALKEQILKAIETNCVMG